MKSSGRNWNKCAGEIGCGALSCSAATRADFDAARSDLDFLVAFQELGPDQYADAYFGLLEDLEALFQRRVDLVVDSAVCNPYFRQAVESTRTLIYAA